MLSIIKIKKEEYVNCDEVFEYAPKYCKGSRSSRVLIKKKEIPENMFIYARQSLKIEGKWIKSDGASTKLDKIFIKQDFVKDLKEIRRMNKESMELGEDEIEEAPPIIDLEDKEKFKDCDGNLLEIETRGVEREPDKVYFKVEDVSESFNIPNLRKTILSNECKYENKIDYVYFTCLCGKISGKKTSKKVKSITKLFLTYDGILRVLFSTRNGKTKPFMKWATSTLFAAQMGTKQQKEQIVGDIMGVNASIIKEVFNKNVNTVPCVYLFTLGLVKDLRKSMNIDESYDDKSMVCKYGYTDSIKRRTSEHMKTYGKIKHVDLKLKYYSYIDPQYISEGETKIKNFMNNMNMDFQYEKYKELIILKKENIEETKEKYEYIGNKYSGHIAELITKLKDKDHELELEKQNSKLKYKDCELELERQNSKIITLEAKNEILDLKMQLLQSKQKK
jgi:hypothetical protein